MDEVSSMKPLCLLFVRQQGRHLDCSSSFFWSHGGRALVPIPKRNIEACASSHHWSRELQALGHTVRLIAVNLKHRLRYIKTDCRDRLHFWLLESWGP
jgi:hypothetical protein